MRTFRSDIIWNMNARHKYYSTWNKPSGVDDTWLASEIRDHVVISFEFWIFKFLSHFNHSFCCNRAYVEYIDFFFFFVKIVLPCRIRVSRIFPTNLFECESSILNLDQFSRVFRACFLLAMRLLWFRVHVSGIELGECT